MTKVCKKCNENKSITNYLINGLTCKECREKEEVRLLEIRAKRKIKTAMLEIGLQICKWCNRN